MSEKTARDFFRKGDRVVLTPAGEKAFQASRAVRPDRLGTVVGFGHRPTSIRIVLDGNETAETHSMLFWQKLPSTFPTRAEFLARIEKRRT